MSLQNALPVGGWQTFFNLGGLAGALSLIWQIATTTRQRLRAPRLRFLEFAQNRDVFNFRVGAPGPGEDRRYVTLQVRNAGKKYARGCVARARATSADGKGVSREVALHWADTSVNYQTTGQSNVDIAPSGDWRLDVAFSRSTTPQCWLASHSALYGNYLGDAELPEGEYRVEVSVTFDDGDEEKAVLRLVSPKVWHELNAVLDR